MTSCNVNIKIYDWVGEYKEQDFKLLYNHPANDSYQSGKTPVKSTDIITFKDASVKYGLNFRLKKGNYYIPMSPLKIISTLIFSKSPTFNKSFFLNNSIVQIYDKDIKIYRYKVADILNNRQATNLRFFISNHITNLEINGTAVDKFIRKKNKENYC